jgi:hypothetical protein
MECFRAFVANAIMTKAVRRAATALTLVLAIAGVPLVMDQCAATCELARAGLAASSAPSCHHTSSPATKIGHPPQRCGHDHHMARMAAADATPAPRALVSGLAMVSGSMTVDALPTTTHVDARAPESPPDLNLHGSPSPLRI